MSEATGPEQPKWDGAQQVAVLVGELAAGGEVDGAAVLAAAGRRVAADPPPRRAREHRNWLAAMAGAYLAWFLPPAAWRLEADSGPGSDAAMRWRDTEQRLLVDVLAAGVGDRTTSHERVALANQLLDDDEVAAVRLLVLEAPMKSQVVDHEGRRPLTESPWWWADDGEAA